MIKNTVIAIILLLAIIAGAQAQNTLDIKNEYIKEAHKLGKNKQIQQAFEYIDELEPTTIKDLVMLTEIPAPPFTEAARADKFKQMLTEAGADKVWIDSVGNVLALRKGTKGERTVALDAHIDTVFPIGTDVSVKYKGDTLVAPGVGDDTRGMVMVLTVLRALNKAHIKTAANLLFIGSVGEEGLGDLRGVKHLFSNKTDVKIEAWISIDGGDIGRVNHGGLGSQRYRAHFRGKGGHSWGAFGRGNPHHALGKAIEYFVKEASIYTAKEGSKTSFNIGRIGGGTSVNSIPYESWFEVDMRSLDPNRLVEIDHIFKTSVKKAVADYNASGIKDKITLELEKIGNRPSGVLPTTLPLIQRTIAATQYFNEEPRLTTGSTNGNIPISLGIPAVTLGRGGKGGNTHSLGEWWLNKDGAKSIKLALLICVAEAELVK